MKRNWRGVFGLAAAIMLVGTTEVYGATIQVTSSENAGAGTLREALTTSNASTGVLDTITFAVSNSITVFTDLSATDPVIIEGGGTTLGSTGQLGVVVLYLIASASGSVVRDLAIVSGATGLYVVGSGNTIAGCRIGTDWANASGRGNSMGASVSGDMNVIGGSGPGAGNVFSGNYQHGLGVTGDHNWVSGNIIGLNSAGTAALGNLWYGMNLSGAYNRVGGLGAGEGNIMAGNGQQGFTLYGDHHVFQGNYFGFSQAGDAVIANGNNTDMIAYGADCWFEGNYFARRMFFLNGAAIGNTIVANVVGMYPDGSGFSGSAYNGIYMGGSSDSPKDNWIGLPNGNGNLFADMSGSAVQIQYATSLRNRVMGNTIVACGNLPISLETGANEGQLPPTVLGAVANGPVLGTADPGEYVEIFLAEGNGTNDGVVQYLGYAVADSGGDWFLDPVAAVPGQYVCAIATDGNGNTSQLSGKVLLIPPTPTPTASQTPTFSPTPTITVTATVSASPTISATCTISPTITVTPTVSPTPTTTPVSSLANLDLGGNALLAYPNPAQERMTFVFHLDAAAKVEIGIYNMAGEQAAVLSGDFSAGNGQRQVWDLGNTAPGVYMARMLVNGVEKEKLKVAVSR